MDSVPATGSKLLPACHFGTCLLLSLAAGCYAPLHSPGISANLLPDDYRYPARTSQEPINFSTLVAEQPPAYMLGTGDVLELFIPDLMTPGNLQPLQVTVLEQGYISVPRIGPILVGGLTMVDAQEQINRTLAAGFIQNPRATIRLVQKGTVNVLVLGAVRRPGMHALPRYENDVAHALAAAEGFTAESGDFIEVHRRSAFPLPGTLPPASETVTPLPAPPAVIEPEETYLDPAAYRQSTAVAPQWTFPAPIQPVASEVRRDSQAVLTNPSPVHQAPPAPPRPVSPYQNYRGSSRPVIRGQSPEMPAPHHQFAPQQFPLRMDNSWPNTLPQPVMTSPAGSPPMEWSPPGSMTAPVGPPGASSEPILQIPLRGDASWLHQRDVVLQPGDVVIVPTRTDEVFFVVGPLSETSRLRFSVNDRDREIGNGLLLPRDREIDVVTAVAMAGYIDPINSPTTVTLHRVGPDGMPLLILVDLIAARSDPRETLLVQPGDIIYLNPDSAWYTRRMLDKVVNQALGTAIGRWLTN